MNLQNGHYLRLMAIVAAPIKVTQALYPGYTDRGNLGQRRGRSPTVAVIAVSAAILAWRYRGSRGMSEHVIEFDGRFALVRRHGRRGRRRRSPSALE